MNDTNREAEIREREQAASPGPWSFGGMGVASDTEVVAVTDFADAVRKPEVFMDMLRRSASNGEFIAHAREDIPWLLAALERARAETGEGECSTCEDEGPLFRWYAKNGEVVLLCEDCHGKAFAWFWDHFREDDCATCADAPAARALLTTEDSNKTPAVHTERNE